MALKTVVDTLDGLEEAVKPFYAETEGVYVLQVDGVDAHPDVANLKSAYERVKQDRDGIKAKYAEASSKLAGLPEDFSPELWEKAKSGKADEAALVRERQKLEAEAAEAKGQLAALQERIQSQAKEQTLTDALTGAGVTDPALSKAARAWLAPSVKLDESGAAMVETDMGPKPLADHVKAWAAGEGASFVTKATGVGARGGDKAAKTTGKIGGSKEERQAAIKAKFNL